MSSSLVQCVPQFSEGRDKNKVDALVEAMKCQGFICFDREMDSDHNRCVITLVGDRNRLPKPPFEAWLGCRIDRFEPPSGAHPRMERPTWCRLFPIEGVTLRMR